MRILWLTWKDKNHPTAGGAELVNEEIARRLARKDHTIKFLVRSFRAAKPHTIRHGFEIIRLHPKGVAPLATAVYYQKHLRGWPDIVIEEVNTVPYLSRFYTQKPVVVFYHQLAGSVLDYQLSFPLNKIGKLAEETYLKLVNNLPTVTVSNSTRDDLIAHGFNPEKISVIPEAITLKPLENLPNNENIKTSEPTLLFLGTLRPMKRLEDTVEAFEIIKDQVPSTKLWIAGASGPSHYHQQLMREIQNSSHTDDITYHGRVSEDRKIELLQKAHLLAVTSVKEGWGLVVTEANSQGTPVVGYNVDGLVDSVRHNETGLLTEQNTPEAMAKTVVRLLKNKDRYQRLRRNAWEWSKEFDFNKTADEFEKIITQYV